MAALAVLPLHLAPPATAYVLFGGSLRYAAAASVGLLLLLSLVWPRWLTLLPYGFVLIPLGLLLGWSLLRVVPRAALPSVKTEPVVLGVRVGQQLLVLVAYIGVSSVIEGSGFPVGLLRSWMLHSLFLLLFYYNNREHTSRGVTPCSGYDGVYLLLLLLVAIINWTALLLRLVSLHL